MTTAFAPGRVNIIGEHTDYTGGLVLPMALELGVTITGRLGGDRLKMTSADHSPLDIEIGGLVSVGTGSMPAVDITSQLETVEPAWGRFVVAVANQLGVSPAFEGSITSNLPTGGTGLSSSTALSCAALMLFGGSGDPLELAKLARQAEIDATGVQIGIMDQAASLAGRAGHALLLDCSDLALRHIEMPESLEVLVVHSGHSRQLADSAYNDRQEACAAIEALIGPLREATLSDLDELADPTLRKRARHVITENARVLAMVEAFAADDPVAAGSILSDGHVSLRDDYEVSIPEVDELVEVLNNTDGIYGARMTGGGFGGSLVALCRPGTDLNVDTWWTRARPGDGARLIES
ncbi:MAG: galactokinase [Acidimicrobiales bacterium]